MAMASTALLGPADLRELKLGESLFSLPSSQAGTAPGGTMLLATPPIGLPSEDRAALDVRFGRFCSEIHAQRNVIERGERVVRAKEIYETLHPSARRGAAPGMRGGGKAKGATVAGFARAIAERARVSARGIQLDAEIATGLSERTRDRLRPTTVAEETTKLRALARRPPEEQARLVDLLEREGVLAFRKALREPDRPRPAGSPCSVMDMKLVPGETLAIPEGARQVRLHNYVGGTATLRFFLAESS